MTGKLKAVPIAAAVLAALVVGSIAIAGGPGGNETAGGGPAVSSGNTEPAERNDDAQGRDDDADEADEQVKDRARSNRARAAALEAVGGGSVTEIERADEGQSGYEVEVRRSGGSYAEVTLDRGYRVVSVENDDD